ncbi:MAG: hypothetical protein K6A72_04155 [Lachnospiraceae bacterium]|nr:hypothetical protein [Lachnospiraceae bacterium]
MPRLKKLGSEEMIAIVDSFFTTEGAGNPSRLKCSVIAEYAIRNGYQLEAYDFRRDAGVRKRIDELKDMARDENGMRLLTGRAYKSLDVERILKARRDPDELRKVLAELDAYWKDVYEDSLNAVQSVQKMKKQLGVVEEQLRVVQCSLETKTSEAVGYLKQANRLEEENRYLRKHLKTHLNTAIANRILEEENLLTEAETDGYLEPSAMESMADGKIPSSFSEAVSKDRKMRNEVSAALRLMWESSEGEEL